ncbi:DUF4199 domain-containing protein [Olleya sp. YS]|uniref:DUF4199 domain-containing protein n=1 Tax=Olleya sp. YS TaxID=3028318 RepID=UPI0024342F7D|nr:DUF4199 domain-containing protein [Olleya sp. YS]WGD36041.1 DUF4199 domain-containing protein [Olleya sp. YS]
MKIFSLPILPIRFGLVMSACLVAYFLLLSLFNLHTNPIFSLFNGVITGFGIFEAIKYYKLEQGDNFSYSGGFTVGVIAGFIAAILFTVFFTFYATEVNSDFLSQLLTVFKGDYNVHIGLVAFVVAIMGFATTVVITLTCMQYFKKSRNIPQNG